MDYNIITIDRTIQLLIFYETELEHRISIFWSQVFRFFYLSLIIMVLPHITQYLKIEFLPLSNNLFPIIGIVASTISLFFSLSYAKRVEAGTLTYQKLNNLLPDEYRRIPLVSVSFGKYFTKRHATIIPIFLYICLIMIGITILANT